LEPLTLLAAVVGTAINTVLNPETVVGSAICGIIGNRVEALERHDVAVYEQEKWRISIAPLAPKAIELFAVG
jgi:hypothetical protein